MKSAACCLLALFFLPHLVSTASAQLRESKIEVVPDDVKITIYDNKHVLLRGSKEQVARVKRDIEIAVQTLDISRKQSEGSAILFRDAKSKKLALRQKQLSKIHIDAPQKTPGQLGEPVELRFVPESGLVLFGEDGEAVRRVESLLKLLSSEKAKKLKGPVSVQVFGNDLILKGDPESVEAVRSMIGEIQKHKKRMSRSQTDHANELRRAVMRHLLRLKLEGEK